MTDDPPIQVPKASSQVPGTVKANSSFEVKEVVIDQEPLVRFEKLLSPEEIERIDELAGDTYNKVSRLAVPRASGRVRSSEG